MKVGVLILYQTKQTAEQGKMPGPRPTETLYNNKEVNSSRNYKNSKCN